MRKPLPILVLLPLLASCGGGSSSAAASRDGATATVTLAWPARTRSVPLTANSAVVALSLNDRETARKTVLRVGDGASTGAAAFSGLTAGRYVATVWTYPTKGGTGVASATGSAPLAVAKAPVTLAVAPASTVATLTLSAPATSVDVGRTLSLTASAKDKDGALVLLANDGVQEKLTWAVSPAGAATVQGDGATVTLTGSAPADAVVAARLKVRDDGATVSATLPVRVVRPVGLAEGGWPILGGDYGGTGAGRAPAGGGSIGNPLDAGSAQIATERTSVVVGPDNTVYTGSTSKVAARGAASWEVANEQHATCTGLALTQDGKLLVENTTGLLALDAATGRLLWAFPPDHSISFFNAVSSAVPARDGTVIVQTLVGTTYALDGATGAVRWSGAGTSSEGTGRIHVVGDDGALYGAYKTTNARPTFYIARYDAATGVRRWSRSMGGGRPTYGLAVVGDTVFAKVGTAAACGVTAIDAATGAVRWTYQFSGTSSWVDGGIAVRDGRVFAPWGGSAVALDATTGGEIWRIPGTGFGAVATTTDGAVYLVNGNSLMAVAAATGALRWQASFDQGLLTLALGGDGTVYLPTVGSKVYTVR